jgi:hypothetical protein
MVIAAAEDSTAILLCGQDRLRELWLWLRAQERRGKFDTDDAMQAQADLAAAMRAVEEGLRLASEKRDRAGE